MISNVLVNTIKTSMGISNRFFIKEGKTIKYYPYLPYKKISENEYIVKPDLSKEPIEVTIANIHSGMLKPYDENKTYINVFQNTPKEKNVMNYDEYGFPIFDDEYVEVGDVKIPKDIAEFANDNVAKHIKEFMGEPVKSVNINKEEKKDKNALF